MVGSPLGSTQVAQWAASLRLGYEPAPDETWFRRWEPHDAIAAPARFYNASTWFARPDPGHIVVVEPWYASDEMDPLERVVMAFAVHPALRYRASIRVGDHFVTRAAYLESAPPPEVKIGDAVWDANAITFARSAEEAAGAFHRRLRKLLVGWGFQGHLELRPGGLVLYYAGLQPIPEGYDRLLRITRELVSKAAAYERS
ncbi:Hypothetical protein A7982_06225 [Minicystis rosea]|nr:Hypothetical protein A7982_06225 [Minicystis rosea]